MSDAAVLTADQLLDSWQGHRRVTRRMIDAFPENELFTYAVGGMRPFGSLVHEMLGMTIPIARGVATGKWSNDDRKPETKDELLRQWDEDTKELDRIWKTIPPHRFQEEDTAFGQWKGTGIWMILYGIDNEVHHRGQGYVYLRALGIEPPAFYDRS